ncbi:hypothetical protein SRHO_G00150250 [Serrasalmus rhombeus]
MKFQEGKHRGRAPQTVEKIIVDLRELEEGGERTGRVQTLPGVCVGLMQRLLGLTVMEDAHSSSHSQPDKSQMENRCVPALTLPFVCLFLSVRLPCTPM